MAPMGEPKGIKTGPGNNGFSPLTTPEYSKKKKTKRHPYIKKKPKKPEEFLTKVGTQAKIAATRPGGDSTSLEWGPHDG